MSSARPKPQPQKAIVNGDDATLDGAASEVDLVPTATAVDEAEAKAAARTKLLIISFLLMLVIGLGNKIFAKLQTLPMRNYVITMNFMSTAIYLPTSFAYILPMIKWGSAISKEQRAIPLSVWAMMGTLDSIAGIMQVAATTFLTSGALIILLQQGAIPISMIISRVLLKAKYQPQHYTGAAIVCAGLVVVLLPQFLTPSGNSPHEVYWIATMIASCVPMTLSSVYKEKALGETEVDPIYLNGWVAVFQLIAAVPLSVPIGYATGLGISQMWPNFVDGLKCYLGHNTVRVATSHLLVDECSSAPLYVNLYWGFNLGFNILIICILKYGSANVLWLALTLNVPFGNIAFALKIMPGHQPMRLTDVVGLVVIMTGLFVFRFFGGAQTLWRRWRTRADVASAGDNDDGSALEQKSLLATAPQPVLPTTRPLSRPRDGPTGSLRGVSSIDTLFATGVVDAHMGPNAGDIMHKDPRRLRAGYFSRLGIAGAPSAAARSQHMPLYNSLG